MKNPLAQLTEQKELSLLWEGNDGWLIQTKNHLISFDLDLYNPERIHECIIDTNLLCQTLDLLMITHEHEDHFNSATCKLLNDHGKCTFVIPRSCEAKAREIGINDNRMIVVEPKQIVSFKDIQIECVRAIHGHINQAVYSGANMYDCGYLVTVDNQTLYQPGDTILLEEHSNMPHIDLLFISTTDHNTKVNNSVKMIHSINPRYIFPQHHSTYFESEDNIFWTHGFVEELYCELEDKYKARFVKLAHNDVWTNRD